MSAASDRLAAITAADFANGGHRTAFPSVCNDVASVSAEVASDREAVSVSEIGAANQAVTAAAQAAIATAQAIDAASSKALAEAAVAGVTVGSTNSLAYPEVLKNLITAADVTDVFIYDTRLDSDGGAWTGRCSSTSWFQETLNTATRGAKRAFPKVALLVLQNTTLTIYDALELDGSSVPRMWMVFSPGSNNMIRGSTGFISVHARNGRIYRGQAPVSTSFVAIDFIEDIALGNNGTCKETIALRNAAAPAFLARYSGANPQTTGCNSIDTIILPGAPLNRLGLPVPTVLTAGASGGFMVIHPIDAFNSRSASVTLTGGYIRARFTADGRIVAIGATAPSIADVGPIPYATTTANSTWRTHRIGASSITSTGGIILPDAALAGSTLVDIADGAIVQGSRLALLAEDTGDLTASLVASIGSNFNSGWMPQGRTVVAALCQGLTGNALGIANPITNGDFATGDLTGWTELSVGSTVASVTGGVLFLPRIDTNNFAKVTRSFTTIVGETYRVTFDQVAAISATVQIGTASGGVQIGSYGTALGLVTGTGVVQFTATTTTTFISFLATTNGTTPQVDNVSVALVAAGATGTAPAAPLDVVGTLARTAVGTGNEIAAFSGFSASNYLTRASDTALAVATGDVMVAAWVNLSSYASAFPIVLAQGSDAIQLGVTAATGFNFRLQSSTAVTDLTVNGSSQVLNQWIFVMGLRRAGTMEIWVNGAREATLAAAGTLTATPGALEVGRSANASVMSTALLRVATYAPTPRQIERMFRDEQKLFQAGAKAFLGGAATATVKRLSRSRFSGRLAVAMSDGLPVFDGLQRIDRHTSATLSPALASSDVSVVGMEAGLMLTGTVSNAGVRRDAVIGLDRLPANETAPWTPRIFRARGVTTDATPLVLAPRLLIAERETVVVRAIIMGRVYGASDTQRLTYERRATYYRDAGGNVTLAGSVQVVGTDVEVTSTADATLVIDTTAQTVAAQVTGIAATRLVWTVRYQIERSTHETTYEEAV